MWLFNNNYNDSVTGLGPLSTSSSSFVSDRFNNANSAVHFNYGYIQVQNGIYFSGDFSALGWMYLISNTGADYSRLFDFGTSTVGADNILIEMTQNTNSPYQWAWIFNNGGSNYITSSQTPFSLNTWVHSAMTLSGTVFSLYLNGVLKSQKTNSLIPRAVTRTKCYIGRSNWGSLQPVYAYIDDLLFFSIGLTQSQVQYVMNLNIK